MEDSAATQFVFPKYFVVDGYFEDGRVEGNRDGLDCHWYFELFSVVEVYFGGLHDH